MVRDFGRYLAALMRHWSGWLTGGVLIAGLTIYERVSGKTVPSSWFIGFAMVSFVLASFLVWREQTSLSAADRPRGSPSCTARTSVPPSASASVYVMLISPRSAGSVVSNST